MSLLPLGNSSADRPARQYHERLNQGRPLPRLGDCQENNELARSGLFSQHFGPCGACPVQLVGYLESGEFVYFRARGRKVELQISRDPDAPVHASYFQELEVVNHELGTGVLPVAICLEYIKNWLSDYASRADKNFKVIEKERSIRI